MATILRTELCSLKYFFYTDIVLTSRRTLGDLFCCFWRIPVWQAYTGSRNSGLMRCRLWMRCSRVRVVRASDSQCRSRNCAPSILRHSGTWGAADEAVLNKVHTKKGLTDWLLFRLGWITRPRCRWTWPAATPAPMSGSGTTACRSPTSLSP